MFERSVQREAGLIRALIIGAFILSIPLVLITTNIRVAISEQQLYDYSVRAYDAERASGIPESELIAANRQIRDYLVTDDPGPLSIRVQNAAGESEPLFNAKETIHMADVRTLVQLMFTVQVLSLAAMLTLAVVMLVLWPARAIAAAALYGALLTGGVLALTGLLAASGFDSTWSQFHVIAFSNDLWQLDPDTDHLIQMFPEEFWFEATMLIGGTVLLEAAGIAAVAGAYLFLTREGRFAGAAGGAEALPSGRARLQPPNPRHYIR